MAGLGPLLWGLLVIAWQVVVILALLAQRYPVRCGVLAAFVGCSLLTSARTVVGVMFYGALLLGLWWLLARVARGRFAVIAGSFERLVGARARVQWRKHRVYGRGWHEHLSGAGLTRAIKQRPDKVPVLKRLEVTPTGDVLHVRLIAGQTPQRWRDSTEALRKAWEARSVRVYDEESKNMVRVVVAYGPSPLDATIPHPGIPTDPAAVDLEAIPIGVTEHGDTLMVPVLGSHMLVAGIMGSGKSGAMWSVILGLAPLIREGRVRLWGWDAKGGAELAWAEDLFYRYTDSIDPEDWSAQLGELVTVMDDKSQALRGVARKLQPTVEMPLDVAIIDEFARLTRKHADSKLTATFDRQIGDLVNVGRAPGVSLCGFLQNPTLETMRHRNEFPWRAALKLDGEGRTDLILGPGAEALGARAGEIPRSKPGMGYVMREGQAEPVAFRLFLVTDAMIADCNARFAPLKPEPAPA